MLEISVIVQLLSLALQYLIAWRFRSTHVSDLYYIVSVANLLVLLVRYLSGESQRRKKVKAFSAFVQALRFVIVRNKLGVTDSRSGRDPSFRAEYNP